MKIEFVGIVETEPEAYLAACKRLLRWGDDTINVTVHAEPRKPDGWLEWLLVIHNEVGRRVITIAMIQRDPVSPYEFHS